MAGGGDLLGQTAPNDMFANATEILQEYHDYFGDNSTATSEPGEPRHASIGDGKSLWWKWTAPTNGEMILSTSFCTFAPVIAVYQGDSVSNLTLIASNPQLGMTNPANCLFVRGMRPGETCYIAVDGWGGQSGSFRLMLSEQPAPVNDDFAGRLTVSGLPVSTVPVILEKCTREPGEPHHPDEFGASTAWWTWTAPRTTTIGIIAGIAMYTGDSISNLTLIASGALNSPTDTPVQVIGGVTYQFAGYPASEDVPAIGLGFDEISLPPNDNFTNAATLLPDVLVKADNTYATLEEGEPHLSNATGKSLWWNWTAPAGGEIVVDCYSTYVPIVATVYAGSAFADLQQLGIASRDYPLQPLHLDVSSGIIYHLAVDGLNGFFADFNLQLHFIPTPANDLFANRSVWDGNATAFDINLGAAGREPGEPLVTGGGTSGRSLWWSFTPTAPGILHLNASTVGSSAPVGLAVFTGTNISSLQRVGDATDELRVLVQPGVEYSIVADPSVATDSGGTHVHTLHLVFGFEGTSNNDSFTNRLSLAGPSVAVFGNLMGATAERNEPKHSKYKTAGTTRWYSWTAPDKGRVYMAVGSRFFEPAMAVYTGTSIRKLHKTAALIFTPGTLQLTNVLSFSTVSNQVYQIAVDAVVDNSIYWTPDEFELDIEFSTLRWTSPSNGLSYRSDAPPPLAIRSSNPAVDGQVASITYMLFAADGEEVFQDTALQSPFTTAPTNLPPGACVALAVMTNNEGRAVLSPPVSFIARPPGDAFSNAIPMSGYHWHSDGMLQASTLERGEPSHKGKRVSGSVWYSWTAPQNGPVKVSLSTPGSAALEVYTGANLRHLKRVKLSDTANKWVKTFQAVSGTNYWLAVFQQKLPVDSFSDNFELDLNLHQALTLVSPTNNATFTHLMEIPFRVNNTIPASNIVSMEYLIGDEVVGTNTVAPYDFKLPRFRAGSYSLMARARLKSGEGVESPTVGITVLLANDYFTNAITLTGTDVSTLASLYGATREMGEPLHYPGQDQANSAWWTWTAPASGRYWIDFIGSPKPFVMVYTGNSMSSLTLADWFWRGSIPHQVELQAVAGTTYRIMLMNAEAEGTLTLKLVQPPANDQFANRSVVTGTNALLQSTLLAASRETGEPIPDWGGDYIVRSVWWSWTAPEDGYVALNNTTNSGGSFTLKVFTGSELTNLTDVPFVGGGDGYDGGVFEVTGGETYQLVAFQINEVNPAEVSLAFSPAPANDYFSNRFVISSLPFQTTINLLGARKENGEPPHQGFQFGPRSVWYAWTAPASGDVEVLAQDQAVVAIYTGETIESLTVVNTNWSPQIFHAEAGTAYQIAVGGFIGSTGPVQFEMDWNPAAQISYHPATALKYPGLAGRNPTWEPAAVLPALQITIIGNQVKIRWPASAPDAVLEANTSATMEDGWQEITNTPALDGDQKEVTLPCDSEYRFFRLRALQP